MTALTLPTDPVPDRVASVPRHLVGVLLAAALTVSTQPHARLRVGWGGGGAALVASCGSLVVLAHCPITATTIRDVTVNVVPAAAVTASPTGDLLVHGRPVPAPSGWAVVAPPAV